VFDEYVPTKGEYD